MALGDDPELKALAKREIQGPASADEQAGLGDDWWNLAHKQGAGAKKQIQARARYWYEKALPELSGLVKAKVEKRLAEASAAEPPAAEGWTVIFRSADPKIWNSDAHTAKNAFAVPLDSVPADIKFLKLRIDAKRQVIIAVSKQQLGTRFEFGHYGWNGTNEFKFNARSLGHLRLQMAAQRKGMVYTLPTPSNGRGGWGFGSGVTATIGRDTGGPPDTAHGQWKSDAELAPAAQQTRLFLRAESFAVSRHDSVL